jgi:signal peptidase I
MTSHTIDRSAKRPAAGPAKPPPAGPAKPPPAGPPKPPPAGPAKPPPAGAPRRLVAAGATALLAALLLAALAVAGGAAAGFAPHVELSDSMRPVLRAGDVVWLERIAARDARRGDVVAFDDPERDAVVLHRVVRVAPGPLGRLSFTTRGDANGASETWAIAPGGRIGRYADVRVPAAGRAVRALHGPPLAALALLSGALLAALALRRIWSA